MIIGRKVTVYFPEWDVVYTGKIISVFGRLYEIEGKDERGRPARFLAPANAIL